MKIKGNTQIILSDAKTGKVVQHTSEDNIVTTGIGEYLKNHGMLNTTPFSQDIRTNLIEGLFGGVLLLDEEQTESVNTHYVESGTKMVANAVYGYASTGTPSEMGSYNEVESGWQDTEHSVFRFVYDWSTSQGNCATGQEISCVCLTSKYHGYEGEGNSQSLNYISDYTHFDLLSMVGDPITIGLSSIPGSRIPLLLDADGNLYIGSITSDKILTIYKAHVCDRILDVRDVWNPSFTDENFKVVGTYDLSQEISGLTGVTLSGAGTPVTRKAGNYVYVGFLINKQGLSRGEIGVFKFSSDFSSLEDSYEVRPSTLTSNSLCPVCFSADATKIAFSLDGTSEIAFYVADVQNPENVVQKTFPNMGTVPFNHPLLLREHGKRHLLTGTCIWDEDLSDLSPVNLRPNGYAYTYEVEDKSMFINMSYNDRVTFYRNHDYIATVNNLNTHVTKDSTLTMKVIYTLTFLDTLPEDEEE